MKFREYTGLAVRIRLLTSHLFLPGPGACSAWQCSGLLVGNPCDSAHRVHIVGGFHTPNPVGDLGDDIIGSPCEYPVDHVYSTMLILVLGRTMRSSIIQASGSIHGPNPMTIVIAVVSWCEGMYPIPD